MLLAVFWISVFWVFYAYLGYPLMLKVISLFRTRPVRQAPIDPQVSFIITAYNEEGRIAEKLNNTLKLSYPKERLEILVASDCSTDRTDEIVRSFDNHRIRLVRAPFRGGKESAQRYAVEQASGEIIVFSDVATILEPVGVSRIVQNFNDPTAGCVSSVDRFIDPEGKMSGEGAYVRYEMYLRALESRVNSVVGLSGSFFAARRKVCLPWAADLQSDFNVLLNGMKMGLRGVSDPASVGYYKNIANEEEEFNRKVRTVQRGISVFMRNASLLNPLGYGLFAWQLLSHKLCRWLVPFFLIMALLSNGFLALHGGWYLGLFAVQMCFYMAALGGRTSSVRSLHRVVKIPFYFVTVNVSILMAWYRYFRGERVLAWEPSQR